MAEPIVAMAKDLVMALIKENLLAPEDMHKELEKVHASLLSLKAHEDQGVMERGAQSEIGASNPVDWRKSIKKYTVECLVCGASFKQLSSRHLRGHDLEPRTYRKQFGIPRTQPLSAKETTAMRKQIVQKSRPWEKAPTYIKATEKTSAASKAAQPKGTRKKKAAASDGSSD